MFGAIKAIAFLMLALKLAVIGFIVYLAVTTDWIDVSRSVGEMVRAFNEGMGG